MKTKNLNQSLNIKSPLQFYHMQNQPPKKKKKIRSTKTYMYKFKTWRERTTRQGIKVADCNDRIGAGNRLKGGDKSN